MTKEELNVEIEKAKIANLRSSLDKLSVLEGAIHSSLTHLKNERHSNNLNMDDLLGTIDIELRNCFAALQMHVDVINDIEYPLDFQKC